MASKSKKRALLLLNPKARSGGGPIDAVRDVLTKAGIELIDAPMSSNETASDVIARMAEAADMAIVGGGDGT
ncbi:lipid kinase, partial [Salmonella enterica subsp. enterica]|nr:lipid kinase [Salmonella enterica subsp. enterica serovar Enteritidis]